jgi:hypothetical protein
MKLYIEEIRKVYGRASYRKIAISDQTGILVWQFSSNKARLVLQLISDHSRPKLTFTNECFEAEVDVNDDIIELIDILSKIERNITRPIYERLSAVTILPWKFKEELAPFILELELKKLEERV